MDCFSRSPLDDGTVQTAVIDCAIGVRGRDRLQLIHVFNLSYQADFETWKQAIDFQLLRVLIVLIIRLIKKLGSKQLN